MSFLARRRSRLDSLDTHASPQKSSTPKPTKSISLIQRVSKLFPRRKSVSLTESKSGGIHSRPLNSGDIARYRAWNASGDSQGYEPSLTIRRPSGLGPLRESSSCSLESCDLPWIGNDASERRSTSQSSGSYGRLLGDEEDEGGDVERSRVRCISSPAELLLTMSPRNPTEESVVSLPRHISPRPSISIPPSLLASIIMHLPRALLPTVALVSKDFLSSVRKVLYRILNLTHMSTSKVKECLEALSRPGAAAQSVFYFTCSLDKEEVDLDLTLFKAMRNMSNLKSLTMARLPLRMARRRSRIGNVLEFKLSSLTLLEASLAQEDMSALLAFLATQPCITSLSLPNLRLSPDVSITTFPDMDSAASTSEPTLPILTSLIAPSRLFPLLVPSRPVYSATICIHDTICEGFQPSALMSSVAQSTKRIIKLSIVFGERIDSRTAGRVLSAAGMECGSAVESLDLWQEADQSLALYKQISSVLPRFTALQIVRLHGRTFTSSPTSSPPASIRSIPPNASRPRPNTFSVSASTPTLHRRPSSVMSLSSSDTASRRHSIRRKPVPKLLPHELEVLELLAPSPSPSTYTPSASPSPLLSPVPASPLELDQGVPFETDASKEHTHERALVYSWSKHCSTLSRVVFLSGAEWARGGTVRRTRRDKWMYVGIKKGWQNSLHSRAPS